MRSEPNDRSMNRKPQAEEPDRPNNERLRHGNLERMAVTIQDTNGAIGRPWIVTTTIERLKRDGSITRIHQQAAEQFAQDFYLAGLDPLRAANLARIGWTHGSTPHSAASERARRRMIQAITQLGGSTSIAGSCAWHVLGEGHSLAQWRRQSAIAHTVPKTGATWVLRTILDVLAAHYHLIERTTERKKA